MKNWKPRHVLQNIFPDTVKLYKFIRTYTIIKLIVLISLKLFDCIKSGTIKVHGRFHTTGAFKIEDKYNILTEIYQLCTEY